MTLIPQKQPTLLACWGNYANLKDVGVENLVAIIPFRVCGPTMKCSAKVSQKECLKKSQDFVAPFHAR